MDFLFSVPLRILTISSIDSKRSSYCTMIGWDRGQTSRNSWIDSLVITNSLCLTQQLIWSPSTLAFRKNSLMISKYTTSLGFSSFVHLLSLNTSSMQVLKGLQFDNSFHDYRGFSVAIIVTYVCISGYGVIRICLRTLGGFLGSWMFGGRHLHM